MPFFSPSGHFQSLSFPSLRLSVLIESYCKPAKYLDFLARGGPSYRKCCSSEFQISPKRILRLYFGSI